MRMESSIERAVAARMRLWWRGVFMIPQSITCLLSLLRIGTLVGLEEDG
jgi:hypothetical protein